MKNFNRTLFKYCCQRFYISHANSLLFNLYHIMKRSFNLLGVFGVEYSKLFINVLV